nr:SRPBCC domain-containing protein [Pelagovum pacificum]
MQGAKPDREITSTRRIAAPPALVWKAWTDPELIGSWWGPDGYHCETESIEPGPGGHWKFTMVGEGQRFPNLHEYGEMDPEKRLTYRLSGFDDMRHHADVVVDFRPEGEGTRVTMRMTFVDMKTEDALKFGALEKGYETLGSLEQLARTL